MASQTAAAARPPGPDQPAMVSNLLVVLCSDQATP
jgi:hypothetical protein